MRRSVKSANKKKVAKMSFEIKGKPLSSKGSKIEEKGGKM